MTPEIITRSFSNDQFVFDSVFFNNYYKLKGNKQDSLIVVDIGAHCGYFSFAALTLGARKVYAFEPFLDNFKILLNNTYNPHFTGRITPYQLGIYTELMIGKFSTPSLIDNIYFDMSGIGLITEEDQNYYPCSCYNLDTILKDYCFNEKIDILKINIGYAEKEILLNSKLLESNVNSICGELTCEESELLEFKKQLGIIGFINFFSSPPNDKGRTLFIASRPPLSDYFNIAI